MLHFFRYLRRTLLEQNRVRTYALYALGEVVLVVVGILLALQINAWNQQRIDAGVEQDYLTLLKQELQNNIDFMQAYYLDRYERKVNGLKMVRSYSDGTYEIDDSTSFAVETGYGAVFGSGMLRANTTVFDEIVSTGQLGVIKNEELRRELIDYYGTVDSFTSALRIHVSGYTKMVDGARPFNPARPGDLALPDQRRLIARAKTEEFHIAATAELTYAHHAIRLVESIKGQAEEVITMIDRVHRDR